MKLVLDNNIFSRSFKNLSLAVFDDIWHPWSSLIHAGNIISVDEVYCELLEHWTKGTREYNWLKDHKTCFLKPTNDEGYTLTKIFQNKKFCEGIKESSLRNGTPEADAFIVAKAKATNGIVVTAESDNKPNSEKIPNICAAFDICYMGIDDFYMLLKNIHNGRPIGKNVHVKYSPNKICLLSELSNQEIAI